MRRSISRLNFFLVKEVVTSRKISFRRGAKISALNMADGRDQCIDTESNDLHVFNTLGRKKVNFKAPKYGHRLFFFFKYRK